jgi:hypothetical protein
MAWFLAWSISQQTGLRGMLGESRNRLWISMLRWRIVSEEMKRHKKIVCS